MTLLVQTGADGVRMTQLRENALPAGLPSVHIPDFRKPSCLMPVSRAGRWPSIAPAPTRESA